MNTDERRGGRRPSARQNDVALVVEDNIMAVRSGLSDEHLEGIDLCTYLAGLVATETHVVGSTDWQNAYRQTLITLGWQSPGISTISRGEMYGLADVETVAKRTASVIGCGETNALIGQSVAGLRSSTSASQLLRASSQVSHKEFALNILAVPSLTSRRELQLGAVFVTVHGAFTLSGTLPGRSGYFSANDELARGFGMTLHIDRFDSMMDALRPWLKAERQRLWEQIRL